MAEEEISMSRTQCRAFPEYITDKCTYVSCYHSAASRLEGRYIKSDRSQIQPEKDDGMEEFILFLLVGQF